MRLNKFEAQQVRRGILDHLSADKFVHPSWLPNQFNGIWISEQSKRAYLRRMAEDGLIESKWHERGWYKWYTYRKNQ